MSAQKQAVYIMIHQEHWVTSQESRSTFAENMVRRSGNVTNVRRNMQFYQIGKLTLKLVALGSTDVTVVPFFQGKINLIQIWVKDKKKVRHGN